MSCRARCCGSIVCPCRLRVCTARRASSCRASSSSPLGRFSAASACLFVIAHAMELSGVGGTYRRARQALDALLAADRDDRDDARLVANLRMQAAELAARAEAMRALATTLAMNFLTRGRFET